MASRKGRSFFDRRVPGAEIVDRQDDAAALQVPQDLQRVRRVLHDRALRDLQHEPRRRQSRLGEQAADERRQLRVEEVERGEILRHGEIETGPLPLRALRDGAAAISAKRKARTRRKRKKYYGPKGGVMPRTLVSSCPWAG